MIPISRTKRTVALAALFIAVSAALVFGRRQLRMWQQSRQIAREVAWIQEAMGQLRKSGEPSQELQRSVIAGRWETDDYLIFSNSWVGIRRHSAHCNDGMGDITILRIPGGAFYLSKFHFCVGIMNQLENSSQPKDANEFLQQRARRQGWCLFSPDGKLQCIVRCPYGQHRGKHSQNVWVWIGAFGEGRTTPLLRRRYEIPSAEYLSWSLNWSSNDEIDLTIFDYWGKSPERYSEDLPTRLLKRIKFQRDNQSSRFIEASNVSGAVENTSPTEMPEKGFDTQ